jgi:hypothetical protein
LDEEFEDGEAVPRSKGRFPKRRIGNYQRAEKPHEKSDNIRRMRERNYEAAPSVTAPSNGHTNGHATPAVITPDFPSRWNALVPERPVDPVLLSSNPKAYRDPVFSQRFDDICHKAKALIAGGAELEFGFLLSTDKGTDQFRWQQLLAGQLEWLKPRASGKNGKHDPLAEMRKEFS